MKTPPPYISPKELSQRWRCSRSSVDRIARRAGLSRVCLGEGRNGLVRYVREEVEAYPPRVSQVDRYSDVSPSTAIVPNLWYLKYWLIAEHARLCTGMGPIETDDLPELLYDTEGTDIDAAEADTRSFLMSFNHPPKLARGAVGVIRFRPMRLLVSAKRPSRGFRR